MTLVRWQPFREIESLQSAMNRMFDGMIPAGDGSFNGRFSFMPPAEMNETPEAIHLKLEVPGLEASDLDLSDGQKWLEGCYSKVYIQPAADDSSRALEIRLKLLNYLRQC